MIYVSKILVPAAILPAEKLLGWLGLLSLKATVDPAANILRKQWVLYIAAGY